MRLSRYEAWYGRSDPPPTVVPLRAGPIDVQLENGDLRAVRCGDVEVVRHLRIAIRDVDWIAVPGERTDETIEDAGDSFRVSFRSRHRKGDLDIEFRATIEGSAAGEISYLIDGFTHRSFRYSRMGLDVLHPLDGHRGATFVLHGPHGVTAGILPVQVGPELFAEGFWRPLIGPYDALRLHLTDGGTVSFAFEGEAFEMEDQRNWTDASLKSFCTPLELGYPFDAHADQRFLQRVTVTYEGSQAATARVPAEAVDRPERSVAVVTPGAAAGVLPAIGLVMPGHGRPHSARELSLLRALRLDHLRVDADLTGSGAGWRGAVERGVETAAALGCALEVAVVIGEGAGERLAGLAAALAGAPVARVLVFDAAEVEGGATPGYRVAEARDALGTACPGATFAGGSASNFMSLNRVRPPTKEMDAVCYPISPQVHSEDDRSVMQTIDVQPETVATARTIADGRAVIVSPITLKPTFNAYASAEGDASEPAVDLPGTVDPRQMSLFAAAWTVGSLGALAESRVAATTWYQTTGWEGLMETEDGPPDPMRFRSAPGMVFPVYHVFAALASQRRATVRACLTDGRSRIRGLVLETDRRRFILANLAVDPQHVRVHGFRGSTALLRVLDETTFESACFDAEAYVATSSQRVQVVDQAAEIGLGAYAVAVLDELGPVSG